ncbi:hypothetical protein P8452_09668 [Trifolium repens]|nr:hypothetical protein P8452_09668 [Trifolium repens]
MVFNRRCMLYRLSKRLPKHLTQVAWVEWQRHVVLMWRLPILNVDCGGLYDGDEHALLHVLKLVLELGAGFIELDLKVYTNSYSSVKLDDLKDIAQKYRIM